MSSLHVLGLLRSEETAEGLVRALKQVLPVDQISLIHRADELHLNGANPHPVDSPVDGTLIGTGIGAALGLTFVASNLAMVGATAAIAGFGPLAALLYGGLFGGMTGGITDMSYTPPTADELLKEVEHGKLLVHAEVDPDRRDAVVQLFRDFGCERITQLQE